MMTWHSAISLEMLRPEGVTGVEIEGIPVALYQIDGQVYATHGICTHALAFLADGFVEGGKIECPLHQGVFDIRSGKALCSPLTRDIRTFAVRVEGDDVFVDPDLPGGAIAEAGRSEASSAMAIQSGGVVIVGAGQA